MDAIDVLTEINDKLLDCYQMLEGDIIPVNKNAAYNENIDNAIDNLKKTIDEVNKAIGNYVNEN